MKPRGLKGELKVDIYSKEYRNILIVKKIFIDSIPYNKKSASTYSGFVYITLEGIDSFEKASSLKDMEICIEREQFAKLPDGYNYIVVVGTEEKKVGLMVDSLIGEEAVVIKPLKDQFTNSPGIAGASILGDGSVSLIIDVAQLLELGLKQEMQARERREASIW